MKTLIALSFYATTTLIAHANGHEIKCYEAEQSGLGDVVYVMEERGNSLHLVYPKQAPLKYVDGCLRTPPMGPPSIASKDSHSFCPGEGQRIGKKVPVEVYEGDNNYSDTVYCSRDIMDWYDNMPYLD